MRARHRLSKLLLRHGIRNRDCHGDAAGGPHMFVMPVCVLSR
jgi:hypothetical protein